MGDRIAKELKEKGRNSFILNIIRSHGATDLEQTFMLRERLKTIGLREEPGGVDIRGRLFPIDGKTDDGRYVLTGYRATFELEDPDGKDYFAPITGEIDNPREAPGKVGDTGAQRDQPSKKLGSLIRVDKDSKNGHVVGTRIYPVRSSPYSVEILVRKARDANGQFVAREPELEAGVLTVLLNRGEEYRVRVHNESAYEAYAGLSIDGVSRFRLSSDRKNRSNVDLISPGGEQELIGYYIDQTKTSAFLVGEYEDGVAVKLGGEAPDIGVISVVFGISAKSKSQLPSDEEETTIRKQTYTVNVPYTEEVAQNYTVMVNGRPETRTRTVQVQKTVQEQREREVSVTSAPAASELVATTQGRALNAPIDVQPRHIGLVRGTVRIRYHAE